MLAARHAMWRAMAGRERRPQHEVVEVFVEGDEGARGEHQGQEAHAAEGDVGDQHDAGEADVVAAQALRGSGAGFRRRCG